MRTIDLLKQVVIHDNISMPIMRYSDFQRGLIIDSQIGSTIGDFDQIFGKISAFIYAGKTKEAGQALLNVRTGIYMALQGQAPSHYAFAAIVKSIDGKEIEDYSESGMGEVIRELNDLGLTQEILEDTLGNVKKK